MSQDDYERIRALYAKPPSLWEENPAMALLAGGYVGAAIGFIIILAVAIFGG